MPEKVIEFEGKVHHFPDHYTNADIQKALRFTDTDIQKALARSQPSTPTQKQDQQGFWSSLASQVNPIPALREYFTKGPPFRQGIKAISEHRPEDLPMPGGYGPDILTQLGAPGIRAGEQFGEGNPMGAFGTLTGGYVAPALAAGVNYPKVGAGMKGAAKGAARGAVAPVNVASLMLGKVAKAAAGPAIEAVKGAKAGIREFDMNQRVVSPNTHVPGWAEHPAPSIQTPPLFESEPQAWLPSGRKPGPVQQITPPPRTPPGWVEHPAPTQTPIPPVEPIYGWPESLRFPGPVERPTAQPPRAPGWLSLSPTGSTPPIPPVEPIRGTLPSGRVPGRMPESYPPLPEPAPWDKVSLVRPPEGMPPQSVGTGTPAPRSPSIPPVASAAAPATSPVQGGTPGPIQPIQPVQSRPIGASEIPANAPTFKHTAEHTDLMRQIHVVGRDLNLAHKDISAAAKAVFGVDSTAKLTYQQLQKLNEFVLANKRLPTKKESGRLK